MNLTIHRGLVAASLVVAIVFLAVALGFTSSKNDTGVVDVSYEGKNLARYPPVFGKLITLDEARRIVPYAIGLPSFLPNGIPAEPTYVKILNVTWRGQLNYVLYLIYLRPGSGLGPDLTFGDIYSSGGILILMNLDNRDPTQIIEDAVRSSNGITQKVSIKGYPGTTGGNIVHVVSWWAKGLHYEVQAGTQIPVRSLNAIAESMIR